MCFVKFWNPFPSELKFNTIYINNRVQNKYSIIGKGVRNTQLSNNNTRTWGCKGNTIISLFSIIRLIQHLFCLVSHEPQRKKFKINVNVQKDGFSPVIPHQTQCSVFASNPQNRFLYEYVNRLGQRYLISHGWERAKSLNTLISQTSCSGCSANCAKLRHWFWYIFFHFNKEYLFTEKMESTYRHNLPVFL